MTTQQICISAVTAGELYYGLARRPAAIKLAKQVEAFLYTVSVMDWTPKTAQIYGRLRAQVEAHGFSLATADMQIAAHAHALGLTLITNDKAFFKLQPLLDVEDWTV